MRTASKSRRGVRWAGAVGVLAAVALAGCGSSSSSHTAAKASSTSSASTTSSTTSSATSATAMAPAAQIKQDWIRFFNGSTPATTKVPLLQNGQKFASVLEAQAANPLAQQAKATVSKIEVVSPSKAKVTYTVLVAGKPALANRIGEALKANGRWQVSDASFCQLLTLEGAAPAICPKG